MMKIQMKVQTKIDSFILVKLAILYIVVWCISPPLSYGTIYRILTFGAIAYIGVYYLYTTQLKLERYYMAMLCIAGYIIFLSFATGDSIDRRLAVLITICVIFCSAVFNRRFNEIKELYGIIYIVFALCVLWNICSLIGIAEIPNIMRILAKSSNVSELYAKRGVGGFGYLYTVLLMLPIGIDCMLNRKIKTVYRLCALVFVSSTYILIFQAQYFLAVILSILLVAVYITMKVRNNFLRYLLLLVLFILLVLVYVNADKILLYLMNRTDMRAINLKLQSMYDLLVDGSDIQSSEFSVRVERYIKSFNYAITHPIVGGGKYSVTGNHSHILDFFAQYGLVLGGIYLSLIMYPFKETKKYPVGYTCMLVYIIMLLLNTLAFSFSVVVYIILPLYYHQVEESKDYG